MPVAAHAAIAAFRYQPGVGALPSPPIGFGMSAASMTASGLNPASLSVSGEYTKVQLNGVSFANLMAWLDAQRRDSRLLVQDAQFSAKDALGQVDATLTLRQSTEPAA